MQIFGHRGAAGLVPENTRPSFERAAALGCDGIECDVWAVEGEAVVIHDDTADRTTDLHGPIHDLGLTALGRCDAGDGAPVPRLGELTPLLAAYPRLVLNVELKEPAVAGPVATWLAGLRPALRCRVILSSFLPEALAAADLAAAPERALCVVDLDPVALDAARALGCAAVHPDQRRVDAGALAGSDLPLRAWTVNDPTRARALAALGVAAVFSDRPDLLLALRRR